MPARLACRHDWLLAGFASDVELHLTVRNTATGATREYVREAARAGLPLLDISAFPGCIETE